MSNEMIVTSAFSEAQVNILTQRTPLQDIRYREGKGGKVAYVDHAFVTRTLNDAFGWDWDFEVDNEELLLAKGLPFEVRVRGKLTVRFGDKSIVKMQFGSQPIEMLRNDAEKPVSIGDAYKGAASDALKKCASLIGIALDLYDSDAKPAREETKTVAPSGASAPSNGTTRPKAAAPMSPVQRVKLIELYRAIHGVSETEALTGLAMMFVETFRHTAKEATYEEAAQITAQLLAAQRAK